MPARLKQNLRVTHAAYLGRRKKGKAFLFHPKVERENISGGIMGDLLTKLFDGSPAAMVLNLIETADLDDEEMIEVRRLVNRKTKEQLK